MTPDEARLLRRLKAQHRGPGQAISAPKLAAILQIPDRHVRADIRALRLEGHPIAGTPKDGYFWPLMRSQTEHTSKNLWSQVYSVKEAAEAFDESVEREFGAPSLFEEVGNG